MTNYIVDASVAAKWLLPEANSDRARALIDSRHRLRAPDLLMSECANVLWKRMVRGELSVDEAREILKKFLNQYIDVSVHLLPSRLVAEQALHIAAIEDRSVYDSLYLALAVQACCQLITADDRFACAIKNAHLKRHIASLSDLDFA